MISYSSTNGNDFRSIERFTRVAIFLNIILLTLERCWINKINDEFPNSENGSTYFASIVTRSRRSRGWVESGSYIVRVKTEALVDFKHGVRVQIPFEVFNGEPCQFWTEILMSRVEGCTSCSHRLKIDRLVENVSAQKWSNKLQIDVKKKKKKKGNSCLNY